MKYSYPDSLIALTAAVTHACSQAINTCDKRVSVIKTKGTMFLKVVTNNYKGSSRVGIKFDNISAGKYFVLIHTAQQYVAMNKTSEKSELMPTESHVTQKRID